MFAVVNVAKISDIRQPSGLRFRPFTRSGGSLERTFIVSEGFSTPKKIVALIGVSSNKKHIYKLSLTNYKMEFKIKGKRLVLLNKGKEIKSFWINYITEKYVCIQRTTSRQRIPLSKISFS